MLSTSSAQTAFAASTCTLHIVTTDNYLMSDLKAIKDFYKTTPGRERLLQARIEKLHIDIAQGNAVGIVMKDMNGRVVAASACHFYGDDLAELSSVLVDPAHTGKGLYPAMRAAQAQILASRTQLLFERLPLHVYDEQVKIRAAEGWSVLPKADALYKHVEAVKAAKGWVSPEDWPPKTAFIKAASGTQFATPIPYGHAGLRTAASAPALAG